MSYFLRVFCGSARAITRRELADFITDGVYFPDTSRFDPGSDTSELRAETWQTFRVEYGPGKQPILFSKITGQTELDDEMSDALSALDAVLPSNQVDEIARKIRASRQIIVIEVHREDITEEAWFMVDAVEAHLARTYDGLVWAEDDGVYDERLQPLLKFA